MFRELLARLFHIADKDEIDDLYMLLVTVLKSGDVACRDCGADEHEKIHETLHQIVGISIAHYADQPYVKLIIQIGEMDGIFF